MQDIIIHKRLELQHFHVKQSAKARFKVKCKNYEVFYHNINSSLDRLSGFLL